jgi:RNA polymerase sigma-70 factor (ECF subfamily)
VRDAGREVSIGAGVGPATTSASLAAQLLGHHTGPSEAAMRAELQIRIQEALNTLDTIDREILVLRHFERLSNSEAARLLELSESAACNRFVRALKRMKDVLIDRPDVMANQDTPHG